MGINVDQPGLAIAEALIEVEVCRARGELNEARLQHSGGASLWRRICIHSCRLSSSERQRRYTPRMSFGRAMVCCLSAACTSPVQALPRPVRTRQSDYTAVDGLRCPSASSCRLAAHCQH